MLTALGVDMDASVVRDTAIMRGLKLVMDNGVGGVNPGGFPTLDTSSKKMRPAKNELKEITFAAGHPLQGQRIFSDDTIADLVQANNGANKLAVKMIAFVHNQGILNMTNDYASPHPQRLAAFHGVRAIAYRAMGVEMFDYVAAFTPDRMVEMGTYLATLRNGL